MPTDYAMKDADGKALAAAPMYTASEVVELAGKYTTRMGTAWTVDDQEGRDVLKRAKGDICADKGYFEKRIGEIEKRKNDAISNFKALIDQHFVPKQDLINDLMQTRAPKWFDIGDDVDEQHKVVTQHIKLDGWESEGASQYKSAIVSQQGAMAELRTMARSNGVGVQQVAELNSAIFLSTIQTINTANNRWARAVRESWSKITIETASLDDDYYDRTYYQRSDIGAAQMEEVTKWIGDLISGTGAWAKSGSDITSQLDKIRNSGANLGTSGKWPQAKAGTGVAADADSMTNTEEDTGYGASDASAEGTLDK